MLMGEYHHNIDDKNRIVIPNRYREEIGTEFVITRGFEKCLYVYSMVEWEKLVAKLNTLPFTKKDARTIMRSFFSGATICEFDKMGRINIASPLVKYADLTKSCVIIGVNDRLEIWSEENFNNFLSENEEQLEDVAEHLFEVTNETL
ncbi:MAG: division/cell wall cluster transcriptional repressor MraZ [Firmicutes bacterium]|nr:division/cell wall cluster transcriptional repressor MraZ [Bacillota bacterium]